MSALAQLTAAGVQIEALLSGKLRATGKLTETTRALIRKHRPEILAELAASEFSDQYARAREAQADPGHERRSARALALLDEEPSRRIAVVAEAPTPGESVGHVCTAVRYVAVGEIAISADNYDAFALWALMDEHAQSVPQ